MLSGHQQQHRLRSRLSSSSSSQTQRCCSTRTRLISRHAGQRAAAAQQHQQQLLLNADSIRQFVAADKQLAQLLGGAEGLRVQELLDGVINTVFAGEAATQPA